MRVLEQLSELVKEVSANMPWGGIINETDTQDGTAVVRELYNDPLVNLYKILDVTGIEPDGTEDGETAGIGGVPKYQIVEALKRLPNVLNDIEQILTLSGTTWSVPFDLTKLPDKYVFFARVTDDYVSGDFIGNVGITSYPFSSSGFSASDEVMVVIDQSGVRAYKLGGSNTVTNDVFTVMGIPVAFNDQPLVYYQEQGVLLTDAPKADYLESIIRTDESDATIILYDIFILQNHVVCCCYIPGTITYKFFSFSISDLTVSTELSVSGITIGVGTDYEPYFYADEENIYITNNANTSANDYEVAVLNYVVGSDELLYQATVSFDNTFVKTTNGAMKNKKVYTFVNGNLESYDVNTGVKASLGSFNGIQGNLFTYNGQIYFTGGEVAKIWV